MQKIKPNLWFDRNAEEAVNFYTSIFKNTHIGSVSRYGKEGFDMHHMPEGTILEIVFELEGVGFTAINGSPAFTKNPSVSFMVSCTSREEWDALWKALVTEGSVLMSPEKYDWSERYGWLQDRFGVSWQLFLSNCSEAEIKQKIVPVLMFTQQGAGKTREAMDFYTSVFDDSSIGEIYDFEPGEGAPQHFIKHAQFQVLGYQLMAFDSPMKDDFSFNEGISLAVYCRDQAEIDRYWDALAAGGSAGVCGWLKDKYGVSWQIIPDQLAAWLASADNSRTDRILSAIMPMKKLILADLEKAANADPVLDKV